MNPKPPHKTSSKNVEKIDWFRHVVSFPKTAYTAMYFLETDARVFLYPKEQLFENISDLFDSVASEAYEMRAHGHRVRNQIAVIPLVYAGLEECKKSYWQANPDVLEYLKLIMKQYHALMKSPQSMRAVVTCSFFNPSEVKKTAFSCAGYFGTNQNHEGLEKAIRSSRAAAMETVKHCAIYEVVQPFMHNYTLELGQVTPPPAEALIRD